jgi:hypothetical protein
MGNSDKLENQDSTLSPPSMVLVAFVSLFLSLWCAYVAFDIASIPFSNISLLKIIQLSFSLVGILIFLKVASVCFGIAYDAMLAIKSQYPKKTYFIALFLTFVLTPSSVVFIFGVLGWVGSSLLY